MPESVCFVRLSLYRGIIHTSLSACFSAVYFSALKQALCGCGKKGDCQYQARQFTDGIVSLRISAKKNKASKTPPLEEVKQCCGREKHECVVKKSLLVREELRPSYKLLRQHHFLYRLFCCILGHAPFQTKKPALNVLTYTKNVFFTHSWLA